MVTEVKKEIINKTTQKKTVINSEIATYSNQTVFFKSLRILICVVNAHQR